MTEHATTDAETDTTGEPKPAEPVVDAHTRDAPESPAPVAEAPAEPVAETAATEPAAEPEPQSEVEAAPAAPAALTGYEGIADPFAATAPVLPTEAAPTEPEQEHEAPKAAKKPRKAKAPTNAAASDEPVGAAPVDVDPVADPTDDPVPSATVTPPADPADAPTLTAEPGDAPGDAPVEAKPANKKKWYAVKVQSGREDTIKAAILRKVAIEGLEETFGQIMIPFEEVIEKKTVKVKDKKTGETTFQEKKVVRKKKKFQGYLFAELEFNDRILYLFRETSGVGDFLNLRGTPPTPEPMSDIEVQQMLTGEKPGRESTGKKVKLDFEKGDRVRIKEGSFINQEGEIKEILLPKDPTDPPKVIVVATLWGRPLDVELEYWQVAKV